MILSLFVAGAVLCVGFEAWKCDSRGRRRELQRLEGETIERAGAAGRQQEAMKQTRFEIDVNKDKVTRQRKSLRTTRTRVSSSA